MGDSIIDRIKKLLRLAGSSNQHEAELAMQRAMELAARHRVDLHSIAQEAAAEQYTHGHTPALKRLPQEHTYAAMICKEFFGVRAIWTYILKDISVHERVTFVGRPSEVEIALYIHAFLVGHFRRCWNKRSNRRLRNRTAFMKGLYVGLYSKLDSARPQTETQETAIVESLNDYISTHIGVTEPKPHTLGKPTPSAFAAGFREGRNTNIRTAVHAAQEAQGRLLQD